MDYSQLNFEFRSPNQGMKYKVLGKTRRKVSVCGFGSYRVTSSSEIHKKALINALLGGINLVDTSTNYSDGQSEELIGSVVSWLVKKSLINRDDLTVVSKAGYIQGKNLTDAKNRELNGKSFEEIVKCSPDLWHCIHPDFISSQLSESLSRLSMDYADVYLLHNPEYFLTYSEINDFGERQTEFYRRIENAFLRLEEEVEKGRIRYYGVSSNTFGDIPERENFVSLARIVEIAKKISKNNHFAVIQLPLNIFEKGAVLNHNQNSEKMNVLEFASSENLGILINRPLNAIIKGRLERIADFPVTENRSDEELSILIDDISIQENRLLSDFLVSADVDASERKSLEECLSLGKLLKDNYEKFESPNHFQEIKGYYLVPRANYALQKLASAAKDDEQLISALNNYAVTTNILLDSVESDLSKKKNEENKTIHEFLNQYLSDEQKEMTLSQKAILMINSLSAVSCTLVGMRTPAYVDDVLSGIGFAEEKKIREFWQKTD